MFRFDGIKWICNRITSYSSTKTKLCQLKKHESLIEHQAIFFRLSRGADSPPAHLLTRGGHGTTAAVFFLTAAKIKLFLKDIQLYTVVVMWSCLLNDHGDGVLMETWFKVGGSCL